ncbi:MAG: thrombospondin type 3 repeat-containing protein [Planctomycetota bacterium]|nr:thrombospondin type 3 repeat-containing protein [Planctomycetota bacterium]
MSMRLVNVMGGALAAAACAGAALAGTNPTATLFGQQYRVQRFTLHESVQWTNPHPFPTEPVLGMVECEGTYYAGNDRIYFSSDAVGEVYGDWKNYVVEATFTRDGSGNYTGLAFSRILLINDPIDINLDGTFGPFPGWDLSPAGLTVNTLASGIGGGGNLITTDTDLEALRAWSLAAGPGPGGAQTCPLALGGCSGVCSVATGFGSGCFFSTTPNTNNEDVTVVPVGDGEIWTIWQDVPFRMMRHTVAGSPIGTFPIPSVNAGEPKGLTFVPNNPRFPAPFRTGVGVAMVGYDNEGPGLRLFDTSGNPVGYQALVTPGVDGIFNPPPGGDDVYIFGDRSDYVGIPMQVESVSNDPATGRLFITIQSNGFSNNFLYVLTPELPPDTDGDGVLNASDNCPQVANAGQEDGDGDGVGDACDNCPLVANASPVDANNDGLGDACSCGGDANRDGQVTFADITAVLQTFGTVYTYPVVLPGVAAGDADRNGSVNFSDITEVLRFFAQSCG